MITLEEALTFIEEIIKPERLSSVQELVFRQCWQGKTYQEIATNSGYDHDYIRVVGSRLWQLLSDILGEKLSKNNFHSVIREKSRSLKTENRITSDLIVSELPTIPIPLGSQFYIKRPPIEFQVYQEIVKPGALICIRGARYMGKTSLALRIIAHADSQGNRTVRITFRQAEETILNNLNQLLRWFCANVTLQLELESKLDDYWNSDLGIKISCTNYLQKHILTQSDRALVIALDDVNHLFAYPKVAQEFIPLLRFWYEEAKNLDIWRKLRLVVIHATEVYVPLQLHQSPFNVGLAIKLPEFNQRQIEELAQSYGLHWYKQDNQELVSLTQIVGGHPYLLSKAFYHLVNHNTDLAEIVQQAATETSIYSDYLRSYLITLYQNPELAQAYQQVVVSPEPIFLESLTAYKLESMGLIKLHGNEASPNCELYRRYFRDRL
jgi:hypothetical protein